MRKETVLEIIDEVMNNREIDSIRNAILAIRDKVIDLDNDTYAQEEDFIMRHCAVLEMRDEQHELFVTGPYFEGAKFVSIDTFEKVDSGCYGTISYWSESPCKECEGCERFLAEEKE